MDISFLEIIKDKKINIGIATGFGIDRINNTRYQLFIQQNFNLYVPDNCFKSNQMCKNKSCFEITPEGWKFLNTCHLYDKQKKLHCTSWHVALPDFYNTLTIDEKKDWMKQRVTETIKITLPYAKRYDIVNEVFDDNSHEIRDFWKELGGFDFIAELFKLARQTGGNDYKLIYNDYFTTSKNPKSDAVYEMIKQFLNNNVPIDEVGFQTHESANYMNDDWFNSVKENMWRFKQLGININFSEIDIRIDDKLDGMSLNDRYQLQAQAYYKLVKTALYDLNVCNEITFWDYSSRYTYIYDMFNVDKQYCPLPLDNNDNALPSHYAIKKALDEVANGGSNNIKIPRSIANLTPNALCCNITPFFRTNTRLEDYAGLYMKLERYSSVIVETYVDCPLPFKFTLKSSDDEKDWKYKTIKDNAITGYHTFIIYTPDTLHNTLFIDNVSNNVDYALSMVTVSYF